MSVASRGIGLISRCGAIFCTMILLALVGCSKVDSDKDANSQALIAYREILEASPAITGDHEELMDASFGYEENKEKFGNHYDLYALIDINQDEIPELITLSIINFRWTPIAVYSYADNGAILLKDPLDTAAHGTFEQNSTANGAYSLYICEDNHIHNVWSGTTPMGDAVEEDNAYVLEGTKLNLTSCEKGANGNVIYFYDIAIDNIEGETLIN